MELQSENINMYSMRVLTAVISVGTLVFYSSIMKLYNCKQDIKILLFLKIVLTNTKMCAIIYMQQDLKILNNQINRTEIEKHSKSNLYCI